MNQKDKDTHAIKQPLRREKELMERFEAITGRMRFPPTLSVVARRGFALALEELERLEKVDKS